MLEHRLAPVRGSQQRFMAGVVDGPIAGGRDDRATLKTGASIDVLTCNAATVAGTDTEEGETVVEPCGLPLPAAGVVCPSNGAFSRRAGNTRPIGLTANACLRRQGRCGFASAAAPALGCGTDICVAGAICRPAGRYRRMSKDYEELPQISECTVLIAMINLMSRRLAPRRT